MNDKIMLKAPGSEAVLTTRDPDHASALEVDGWTRVSGDAETKTETKPRTQKPRAAKPKVSDTATGSGEKPAEESE